MSNMITNEQIQTRAHQLWEERCSPLGTPETDWFGAEQELSKKPLLKAAREIGSAMGKVVGTLKN
jgi:hypothetical protein